MERRPDFDAGAGRGSGWAGGGRDGARRQQRFALQRRGHPQYRTENGEGTTWISTASGQITTNTTWSQNVLVTGDVVVTSGVTLTIAPGVTVFFAAHSDDRAGGFWTDRSDCS